MTLQLDLFCYVEQGQAGALVKLEGVLIKFNRRLWRHINVVTWRDGVHNTARARRWKVKKLRYALEIGHFDGEIETM